VADHRDPVAIYDSTRDAGNFLHAVIIGMGRDGTLPTAVQVVWGWEIRDMWKAVGTDDLDAVQRLGRRFTRMRLTLETGGELRFREGDRDALEGAAGLLYLAAPELGVDEIGRWAGAMVRGIRVEPAPDIRSPDVIEKVARLRALEVVELVHSARDAGAFTEGDARGARRTHGAGSPQVPRIEDLEETGRSDVKGDVRGQS
jgi:hypothetical protein